MKNAILLLFLPLTLFAQERNFWKSANVSELSEHDLINYSTKVNNPILLSVDQSELIAYLTEAPDRYEASSSPIQLEIPNPDGDFDTFTIFSTQTMARGLADKFQQINSYVGYNVDKKSHTARITSTPTGLYVMTLGSKHGQTFINPYALNSDVHMIFSNEQCHYQDSLECHHDDELTIPSTGGLGLTTHFIQEGELRKYRLAVAANVQYSEFHWQAAGLEESDSDTAKKAAVQAAIVVSIDRVNQMFERDFGVTLELVANNDDVIFLGNPNDDPYDNTDHLQMIDENQIVLDTEIGNDNYDVGHVFNTNGGGLASTPSVCNDNFKARGSTGSTTPAGDPFDIRIASHEFGHQFGANHTQNNDVNRNNDTAVETGSGSTIMGYAGAAAPNVQNNTDPMFHYISISEVSNLFSGFNGNCAEIVNIANESPTVDAIPNYTIPQNTPFMLEAVATDPDDDDLTYSWEQFDNEIAPMPPEPTATDGPAFRTFLPTTSPIRYFPSMSTLTEGNYSNTWEVLSTVNRTYNFAVVVRDNNPLGGQVTTETTTVTVDDSAGPFRVTSQDDLQDPWFANDTQTITWDVAGTDDSTGINAQEVDIILSLDGGETFTEVVLQNTPNDGEEDIIVPDVVASNVRIMVKASDNIFFDINEQAFAIGTAFTPEYCEAGSDNQDFTNISQVEFNTIDNSSGNDGYSDFTSINTTVQRSETYSLTVKEKDDTVFDGSQVIVWIDFNQNGSFDDPGEKVIETDSFDGDWSIYPFGGDITIPSDAQLGETTMRIRIHSADFGEPNTTPCGNSTFGEVEDYTLVIYDDFVYYDDQWEPNLPTGLSTSADNVLVVDGETTLSGTTELHNLTLQIGSRLSVEGILNVAGNIENDGNLVFLSDENGSGQLDEFSGSISRPVEVERYIPSGRAFRFLSSPVGGVDIADA
ncbi:MAG: M12 family metallo-peptidase, partial [Flavobacteriaceae bacterium]|nr:M12 family metallo-peptidase [Flavobacteriaceae bacterium]